MTTLESTNPPRRSRPPVAALATLLLLGPLLAPGCEKDPEIRPEGTAGGATRPEDLGCPSGLPGAELVRLQTQEGVVFCMDQREVTWGEYDAFLTAKRGDVSGQPPECSWNRGYEPEYYVPNDTNYTSTKCEEAVRPVSKDAAANCLDFCDALAYCAWAGKRLCGAVGVKAADGGVMLFEDAGVDLTKPTTEYGYACTQGGTTKYPYGDDYEAARCDAFFWGRPDAGAPPAVGAVEGNPCHGARPPFDQIYGLVGAMDQWSGLCRVNQQPVGPPTLSCMIAGAYPSVSDVPGCLEDVGTTGAASKSASIGLRCCADPTLAKAAAP